MDYEDAFAWAGEKANDKTPHLLLGNGFSMAYNATLFGYTALATKAKDEHLLPDSAVRLMEASGTSDFEAAMRSLEATEDVLRVLDAKKYATVISQLHDDVEKLREALAHSIAGLHPERPHEIDPEPYRRVRKFLDRFKAIYTVNYDLLLYWTLMQDFGDPSLMIRSSDDGFRDSGVPGDETVLWNIYDPHKQNVHYLHGALHLFVDGDGLHKITWIRTAKALIDQVRAQLARRAYPLYVAEGDSKGKLARINGSAYLSKALRSLSACGGGLVVYGHSLAPNDDHVFQAVIRSKMARLAVSIYGDPNNDVNKEIRRRALNLVTARSMHNPTRPLEVEFYDASSVKLW